MKFSPEQIEDLGLYLKNMIPSLSKPKKWGEMDYDNLRFLVQVQFEQELIDKDLSMFEEYEEVIKMTGGRLTKSGLLERASIGRALREEFNRVPLYINHEEELTRRTASWRLERGI